MSALSQTPLLLTAVLLVLAAGGASLILLPGRGARRRRLRDLVTLLRAADPSVRVQALERAHSLAARDRLLLGGLLRRNLATSSRTSDPTQPMTVWFIRQILALLVDARTAVRSDAARALRAIMQSDSSQLMDRDDPAVLSPAVAGVLELAGGRVLAASRERPDQTRVLAFAEMLEAGLRPLALGLRDGIKTETLEPLTAALRDRSPRVRRSLYEVLAALGGEKSTELLVMALQDPSPDLRAQAARSLGKAKAGSAVPQLMPLLRDPIGEVRAAAASALAEVGLASACASVIEALAEECRRGDSAEAARAAMTDAIARLADGGRPELAQALTSLPRPVASRLAASLERNGVIERWLAGREAKEQSELLASAAELGVSRPFLEALDSAEQSVRLQSAAALGHSHDPAALTAVAALLADSDAKVRGEVVNSLARLSGPLSLGPLARGASDPDSGVRLAAVGGLGHVLSEQSAWRSDSLPGDFDLAAALSHSQQSLLLAARDPGEGVRVQAAQALAVFSSGEAASALVGLALGDASQMVRETATQAVARCGFAHIRHLLAAALEHQEESQRVRAMGVLGALGGSEAGRYLVEALRDPAAQVREAALSALSHHPVDALADRLAPELRNSDPRVRAGVATLLGEAGSAQYVDALAQALADPDQEVRVSALTALAQLGRPVRRYESAFSARLSDPSPRVRETAAAALEALREAWTAAPEAADWLRAGPLSAAGAAALVEDAVGGELEPLLRALDNAQSARSLALYLAGLGRGKLNSLLSALRRAEGPAQMRAVAALSQALRQAGAADGYLAELKAIDSEVRLMAVEMAGLLATPEAIGALLEVLERDPLPEVRSRAASMLAETPGGSVEAALLRAQAEDPNEVVRLVAARVLGRLPQA
jgi:HEAT repeat protein